MQLTDPEETPFYHFSVDDVFKSLIEITDNNMGVFEHPFFAFLKELHDEFGISVDLYLFFQKEIDGKLRTLREVSSSLKQTFNNNPWIRFGPHALDFYTPPYTQTPEEQTRIFDDIYNEIFRFTGEENISKWVRLHVFSESYELRDYFHAKGVEALFTTDKDRITTRMPSINDSLRKTGFAEYNGLKFIRTHIRTENLVNGMIRKEELGKIIDLYLEEHNHLCFLTHEYELFRDEVKSMTIELIRELYNRKIPNKIHFNENYKPVLSARNMQAVILAAGVGKRLMPLTKDMPKSLVEVGGVPLIIRQLNHLSRLGNIEEIIIVIGHGANKVKEILGNSYENMKITYVENPDYDKTNNIYSLWLARDLIKKDFILMEGDIIFDFEMLNKLINTERRDKTLVAPFNKEWMDGTIVSVDKNTKLINQLIPKSQQDSALEYSDKYKTVNVYFFTREFYENHFKKSLEFYVERTGKNEYYELILGVLAFMGVPIYAEIIEEIPWFEIDDHNDLEIAEDLFAEDKAKNLERIHQLYGGYWRYNFLDFCYLYNPYFPPKVMLEKISKKLPGLIGNYPSSQKKLCTLLSRWYKENEFTPENLIIGNGSSEIIRIINKNLINKITIPVPGFNEYEAQLSPEQINYYYLKKEDNFNINPYEFIESVRNSGSGYALIVNPNNPTGNAVTREDIEYILRELPNVAIIVDESFVDYTGDREKYSVQELVGEYPNLILIRSISKEFGAPGLRIGYLLTSNEKIKTEVKKYLPIWNINSIAEIFLELFIKYEKEYQNSIKKMTDNKLYLIDFLDKSFFIKKIFPSFANFILCELEGITSEQLQKILFSKYNIFIKDCSNKKGLKEGKFIRISVRTKEDIDKLISALKEISSSKIY